MSCTCNHNNSNNDPPAWLMVIVMPFVWAAIIYGAYKLFGY